MTKDWRGNVIMVGATVVYPSRQSSSLWMNEGRVVSIENDGKKIGVQRVSTTAGWQKGEGERVSYPDPHRLTVVRRRR